jgi:hypothetical protein
MSAGPWTLYKRFRKYLGDGSVQTDGTFRISLYTSASNAADTTLSIISQLSGEVQEGNGYSSSGRALTHTWTTGASAAEFQFAASAAIWTPMGGPIPNIKFAVIWASGASAGAQKLVCYSQLSTGQFTVTTAGGSFYRIRMNEPCIFTLN